MEETVRNLRSDDPVSAVHDARRRVFAVRTARLALRREPDPGASEVRGRGLMSRVTRRLAGTGKPVEGEGILDLGRPGAAYDHGEFAVTEIGDGIWGGPPGRALATLTIDPNCRPGPLWFLGAVEFLNAAVEDGLEEVRGMSCRRFQVSADLAASAEVRSAETSAAMNWNPDLALVPDPVAVDITVWIDHQHLRRVSLSLGNQVHTLELWDLGADVAGFDWARLSTFRTNVAEDVRGRPNTV